MIYYYDYKISEIYFYKISPRGTGVKMANMIQNHAQMNRIIKEQNYREMELKNVQVNTFSEG